MSVMSFPEYYPVGPVIHHKMFNQQNERPREGFLSLILSG